MLLTKDDTLGTVGGGEEGGSPALSAKPESGEDAWPSPRGCCPLLPQGISEFREDPHQQEQQPKQHQQAQQQNQENGECPASLDESEELREQLKKLLLAGHSAGEMQQLLAAASAAPASAAAGDNSSRSSNCCGWNINKSAAEELLASPRLEANHSTALKTTEWVGGVAAGPQQQQQMVKDRHGAFALGESRVARGLPVMLHDPPDLWQFSQQQPKCSWGLHGTSLSPSASNRASPISPSASIRASPIGPRRKGLVGASPSTRGLSPGYPLLAGEDRISSLTGMHSLLLQSQQGGPRLQGGEPTGAAGDALLMPSSPQQMSPTEELLTAAEEAFRRPVLPQIPYGPSSPSARGPEETPLVNRHPNAIGTVLLPQQQQQRWAPAVVAAGSPAPRSPARGKKLFFYCPSCLEAFPSTSLALFAAHISQKGHTVQQLQRLRGRDGYFQCPKCTCKGSDLLGLLRHWQEGGAAHHGQKVLKRITSRAAPPGFEPIDLQQQQKEQQHLLHPQRALLHQVDKVGDAAATSSQGRWHKGSPRPSQQQHLQPPLGMHLPPSKLFYAVREGAAQPCSAGASSTGGEVGAAALLLAGGPQGGARMGLENLTTAKSNPLTDFHSTTGSQRSSGVSDASEEGLLLQKEQQQQQHQLLLQSPYLLDIGQNSSLSGLSVPSPTGSSGEDVPLTKALFFGGEEQQASYFAPYLQLYPALTPLDTPQGNPNGHLSLLHGATSGCAPSQTNIWGPLQRAQQGGIFDLERQQQLGLKLTPAEFPGVRPKPFPDLQQLLQQTAEETARGPPDNLLFFCNSLQDRWAKERSTADSPETRKLRVQQGHQTQGDDP